jgi:hypothetical protein
MHMHMQIIRGSCVDREGPGQIRRKTSPVPRRGLPHALLHLLRQQGGHLTVGQQLGASIGTSQVQQDAGVMTGTEAGPALLA